MNEESAFTEEAPNYHQTDFGDERPQTSSNGYEKVSDTASNWGEMSSVEISLEDMCMAAELSRLATPRQLNVARRLINGVMEARGDCGRRKVTKPEIFRVLTEMYINKIKREMSRVDTEGETVQNTRSVLLTEDKESVNHEVASYYHRQIADCIDQAVFENIEHGAYPQNVTTEMVVKVLNTRIQNLRMKYKKLENDLERAQENSL